jgi:hypothetical protein
VPEENYEFGDGTYDRLDRHGVSPLQVLQVLHGGARARRHTGAVLQVAGVDQRGRWLVVVLVETSVDDRYTVVSAREMDTAEIAAVRRMRGEQP